MEALIMLAYADIALIQGYTLCDSFYPIHNSYNCLLYYSFWEDYRQKNTIHWILLSYDSVGDVSFQALSGALQCKWNQLNKWKCVCIQMTGCSNNFQEQQLNSALLLKMTNQYKCAKEAYMDTCVYVNLFSNMYYDIMFCQQPYCSDHLISGGEGVGGDLFWEIMIPNFEEIFYLIYRLDI